MNFRNVLTSGLTRIGFVERKQKRQPRKRRRLIGVPELMECRQMLSATSITVGVGSNADTFIYNTGTNTFGSPVMTSGLGVSSGQVAMGDFNGDGYEDFVKLVPGAATTHGFFSQPAQLQVSLNNGSGGYGAWTAWDSSISLSSSSSGGSTWGNLHVGDFNGDGKADVLMQNKETGEWDLWTSTGTGFTRSVFGTWATGQEWTDIVVGDFNGDGIMDIMGRQIANEPNGAAPPTAVDNWYVGLGTSTSMDRGTTGGVGSSWWLYTTTPHSAVVANAVVGNFDGDSAKRDDLAIRTLGATASDGSRPSTWQIYTTGTAGTTITSYQTLSTTWDHALAGGVQQNWSDVQVGDFNGDGKDDILGRNSAGQWYLSLGTTSGGSATIQAATMVADWSSNGFASATTVAGDFDGDHQLELVAYSTSGFQWYRATYSGGSFTTLSAAGGMSMMSAPTRDYTFVNGNASGYSTFLGYEGLLGSNSPLSPFEAIITYNPNGGGDGFFSVGNYLSNGNLTFRDYGGAIPSNISAPFSTATNLIFYQADFNNDGLPDLLLQGIDTNNPNEWYLLLNNGNAFVNTPITTIPQTWSAVATTIKVADFTGDGKSDLLVMVQDTSTTAHWELYTSTGTGFTTGSTVASMSSTTNDGWLIGGAIGDFDGDGKSDLAIEQWSLTNPNVLNIYVAYSNGSSPWTISATWSRLDGTNPGDTHLFFIDNQGDRLRVGDVTGALSPSGYPIDSVLGLQNLVQTGGDIGQVWVGVGSTTRGSGGSGSWLNLPAPFDFSAPHDQYVFEVGRFVNLDIKADIMINPTDDLNTIRVYESTGSSFNSTPAFTGAMGSYYGLIRPVVADINRDGYDDLVWGSTGYNISLMDIANVKVVTTPNTGPNPGPSADWYGYVTTLARLRRRLG